MLEKMQKSQVVEDQIEPYMDKVYQMLGYMTKEEIIKGFVSLEFNRFLEYYKNAPDLNYTQKNEKSGSDKNWKNQKGRSMSRILFNIGKGKNITKRDVIDLVTGIEGAGGMEIGMIEIYKRATSVEVERKMAKKIISELNLMTYKGINIDAEENYEFTGNDFRNRNPKNGRKKKRR